MRLKRLELCGFKSFADRTSLLFDHSLVGIVGPNGCGKSNVVDAIRWVLGETRPTSMRGGEMTDVIFKGSVSRPSMSFADVSMVLDNSGGELGERGAEVAITRRVDRSGEGEYLINGEKVRLKDVRDMLYDTGLGSRGYAVLEQGRIDAVLSQNALDRRAIFEEAAGISRYRQRRKETEARLKRVELDMQRLDDILRELATRVRSLKIQAGKAERYVQARDEWRAERKRFLEHRVFQIQSELADVRTALASLEQRCGALRTLRQDEESDAAAREREQRALSAEVDRLSSEVGRLIGEGRALDERASQLQERVVHWRAGHEDESARALALAEQLEVREAELEKLAGERAAIEATLAERSTAFAALEADAVAVRAELAAARERCERGNTLVLRLLNEKTSAENALSHQSASRGPLAERAERARMRMLEVEGAAQSLASLEGEVQAQVSGLEAQLVHAEEERAALATRLAEHDRRLAELSAERTRGEVERARLQSRIDALLDWEREREALEAGARALISGLESGEAPCTREALSGVLADHLRTSTRFARALDAALAERALALVADAPETATRLVAWLSERRAGAVRLVVPGALGARRDRGQPQWTDAERELVQGRLIDSVEVARGLEPLAESLVGDVWIARDLAAAVELVRAHAELRFATLEGDLVDAAGVSGGHHEMALGAIGRRASASELETMRDHFTQRLDELGLETARVLEERSTLAEQGARAEGRLGALRESLATARGEGAAVRGRLADIEDALAAHRRESGVLAEESARLERAIEETRARVAATGADWTREAAQLAELETARAALEERREALARSLAVAEVERARARSERDALAARHGDLERSAREQKSELDRARRLAQEHHDNAQTGSAESERLAQESLRIQAEHGELERRLGDLRATERAGREAIETYRRRADAVTRELEDLSGGLSQKKLEEQRLELEKHELVVRAGEDLALGESQLLDGFAPDAALLEAGAIAALEARVAELKGNLDRLGPVNTEAVAELAEAEGRHGFLDGQRKDLQRSRQALEEALLQINSESERLFLETFNEVRVHFQELFRKLFGGGKADLELSPGEGPLEAGIDISARPPGREMLPIGLLSGGQRTMTALALLFAIFKARPSPFCVLDEVDAALDDANVGRFLAMLDEFRRGTQFVVVTHNKGTMAACSALYGVTMEVKGVSRHVAVQFGEVDRFDPEATGNAAAASAARDETLAQTPGVEPAETAAVAGSSAPAAPPASASSSCGLGRVRPGKSGIARLATERFRPPRTKPSRARPSPSPIPPELPRNLQDSSADFR
jgi:chromosome segregation protein